MAIASASIMPEPPARGDFLKRVRAFCQDLYRIGSPEVRAATFIFENTICYQEFHQAKRLTLDEFVNGRKRANGERLGPGCGFKDRANASKALSNLERRGVIEVESDPKDAARQKKFYRLTLPSLTRCCQSDNSCEHDTSPLPSNVVEMTTRCSEINNRVLSDQQQGVVNPTTRSGEERGEVLREVLKENTPLAPLARGSDEPTRLEEDDMRFPLQGHKAIAQAAQALQPASPERAMLEDDLRRNRNYLDQAQRAGANFKRISELKRTIADLKAKLEALPSSDSQEQQDESTSTALYEEKPQAPVSLIRARYQDELDELRAIMEDAKSAWKVQQSAFDFEISGSKRAEMRHDVMEARRKFDEAHWNLALAELAVDFMEQGMSRQEAFDEAYNRLSEPQDEPPATPADDAPAVLFPEAEPAQETQEEKQPATLYEVLGSLFLDMEHASADDKKAVAVVAERIKKRGLTIEDVQERYRKWLRKFESLKAKTIWHFEKNIAVQGVC